MKEDTRWYDQARLQAAGVDDMTFDCGLWYYPTPKGRMACPPYVRTAEDIEAYFRGSEREFNLNAKRKRTTGDGTAWGHPPYRPVEALDPITGEVVDTFDSITAAARAVQCAACTITNALRTHGIVRGCRWRRAKTE